MNASLNTTGRWTTHPAAEALLVEILRAALLRCPPAQAFANDLLEHCGVRLRDIIDHIQFADAAWQPRLEAAGWARRPDGVWRHALGYFPDFVAASGFAVAFRTESVQDFLDRRRIAATVEGELHGPYRRARVFAGDAVAFWAVERNGHVAYDVPAVPEALIREARIQYQKFRTRRRQFDRKEQGLAYTEKLVDEAVAALGPHWACDLFFRAERAYFTVRCEAARLQYRRQMEAGIGWCNIDHHTYDSSRDSFRHTIRILEKLGYECRELFYAGSQAGWGSQILEQPVLRSTIFADIDLAPEELEIDFAHIPLAALPKARRAGIWCAMHGESMLEAGLNHIAGMYDQRVLRTQLRQYGVTMMQPFSDFPELYQELTHGERWAVDPQRVDDLERGGHLTAAEAEDFRLNGALAAHLENLERNDGFKGFNQPGIDGVLRVIDPRKNLSVG